MKNKITFKISFNDYIIYKNLPFEHRKRVLNKFRMYGREIILQEKRYYDYEVKTSKN